MFYVATGKSTTSEASIQWSTDGRIWNSAESGGFYLDGDGLATGNSVAWNGSMWVAVGAGEDVSGTILWSNDGKNWNKSYSGGFTDAVSSYNGFSVIWAGGVWYAVGNGSTTENTIQYSYDGKNWLDISSGTISNCRGIEWDGQRYVSIGSSTSAGVLIQWSDDGQVWIPATGDFIGTGVSSYYIGISVKWNGTLWVASSSSSSTTDKTLHWSDDGKIWYSAYSLPSPYPANINNVTWDGQRWYALCTVANNIDALLISSDGKTWITSPGQPYINTGDNANMLVWDGSQLILGGGLDDASNSAIKYSTDNSITWIDSTSNQFRRSDGRGGLCNGIASTNIWYSRPASVNDLLNRLQALVYSMNGNHIIV